ncbi:MAG: alpha/beta hydrolase [Dehalococcoidia bacterium]
MLEPDAPPLPRRAPGEEPRAFRREVNGVTIAGFEWEGGGDPILLVHATGFHARVWDEVARRLPLRRVIALDMRGHGRSSKPAPPYAWRLFGEDVSLVLDDLDLRGIIGVGHSMGGHTIVDAAIRRPQRFASLVLVDPTIFAKRPAAPGGSAVDTRGNSLDYVSRRRNEWASVEEMVERFAPRFPFNAWEPQALRDYATHGLLPAPGGDGLVLACPPAVEAAVYAGRDTPGSDLLPALDRVTCPARVLRARAPEPGEEAAPFTVSPTIPDLAARLPRGVDVPLPHLTHFIPMQAPDLVARHILMATEAVS